MISEAIIFKFGFKAGLTVSDNQIVDWPYIEQQPTQQQLNELVSRYEFYIKAKKYIEQLLNEVAQQKQYDNSLSISTYANSTNQDWKKEAEDFLAWRDLVWSYSLNIYNQVLNEEIPLPEFDEFINNLPIIQWSE